MPTRLPSHGSTSLAKSRFFPAGALGHLLEEGLPQVGVQPTLSLSAGNLRRNRIALIF